MSFKFISFRKRKKNKKLDHLFKQFHNNLTNDSRKNIQTESQHNIYHRRQYNPNKTMNWVNLYQYNLNQSFTFTLIMNKDQEMIIINQDFVVVAVVFRFSC